MYFLTEDERRLLQRKLLPEARTIQVHPTLRGWHWAEIDAPARPTYQAPLGVSEVANRYCSSGRDVFVQRVLGQRGFPTADMEEGTLLHAFAAAWVTAAKQLMYCTPTAAIMEALPKLLDDPIVLPEPAQTLSAEVAAKMQTMRRFETYRLLAATQGTLARQPDIGRDALAGQVLPVVVEQRVDGQFLGLSPHLAVDALFIHGPIVMDLKFGLRQPFHRLTTTGYALALESAHETPVDLGCIVYVRFGGGTLIVERDFHFIDDELRTRFIEERDRKQRLVEEELDPGLPDQCYERCRHLGFCGAEAQRRISSRTSRAATVRAAGTAGPGDAGRVAGSEPAAGPRRPASANLDAEPQFAESEEHWDSANRAS